ncbi:hypothetical protein D3C72_1832140 [compost metagenome]
MQHHAAIVCIVVQNLRFFVEDATNAVTAVFSNHGKTFRFDKFLNGGTEGTQTNAWFHHLQRQIEAFLRHTTQALAQNGGLADDKHF